MTLLVDTFVDALDRSIRVCVHVCVRVSVSCSVGVFFRACSRHSWLHDSSEGHTHTHRQVKTEKHNRRVTLGWANKGSWKQ